MVDVLKDLQAFSWRGIEFPVTKMRLSISQTLAEHQYWGFDGARIEATGRRPLIFTATIPFVNGIVPGKSERWGVLYPFEFRKFLAAMSDRSTGALIHPEMGELTAKPHTADAEWKGDEHRDGAMVEATWTETLVEDYDLTAIDNPSPIAIAETAALDLDASKDDLESLVAEYRLPKYERTFADDLTSIAAVGDQIAISQQRVVGKINNVIYKAKQVRDSALRAKNALMWPAIQSATRIADAAIDIRKSLLESGKDVVFYSVPKATTVAGLVPVTGASTRELLELNPQLAYQPIVRAGTVVRYYTPRRKIAA
jgi:prophage DNA circulation protein